MIDLLLIALLLSQLLTSLGLWSRLRQLERHNLEQLRITGGAVKATSLLVTHLETFVEEL